MRDPERRGKQAAPFLIGGTAAILVFFVGASAMSGVAWWAFFLLFIGIFFVGTMVAKYVVVPILEARMKRKDASANVSPADGDDTKGSLSMSVAEQHASSSADISLDNIHPDGCDEGGVERLSKELKNASEIEMQALEDSSTGKDQLLESSMPSSQRVESAREHAERWFVFPLVMTACCVSFAHGGNDIANAIGPLSELLLFAITGSLSSSKTASQTLWYVTPLGGLFIVLGLATWGKNVVKTVGTKITLLNYSKGFAAQLGAAVAVLVATLLGMPISTTAVLIGSISGVGLVDGQGRQSINLKMVCKIVAGWIVTLPVAGVLSVIFFAIIRAALGKHSGWEADPRSNCSGAVVAG